MGIANKFNSSNITWNIDTDGLEYCKASELPEGQYAFNGCFITSDHGYGEGGVIISNVGGADKLVNTPASFVETIKLLRADEEAVEQIKAGKLAFKVESFMSKYKRKGFKIVLIDID